MCRLLVDTMVWNYVGKAGVLAGFIEALGSTPAVTPYIVGELEDALVSWPELRVVVEAVTEGAIERVELDDDEHRLLSDLHNVHTGLSETDCSLLALAILRGWEIVTCERSLRNVSSRRGAAVRELGDLVDDAEASGSLSAADRDWIDYYARGGTQRRPRSR